MQSSYHCFIMCSQYCIKTIICRRVCTTPAHVHTSHMPTSHIYPKALKCPTLLSPKSLAALLLKDITDWKCVRKCETQSPEHSLFSVSVTECGCLLVPLRNTGTREHILHPSISLLNLILAILSIKPPSENQQKDIW